MKIQALVVLLSAAAAAAKDVTLPGFTSVQVCTPFNVVVAPGTKYQLSIEGDKAVLNSVKADVKNSVLSLQSNGSFDTQKLVKVTVRLPANKLKGVTVLSAAGITVVVDKGFAVNSFSAKLQGGGGLQLNNITTKTLKLTNSGVGDVVAKGVIGTAQVQTSGTGDVHVAGVTSSVSVSASGTGTVSIDNSKNAVRITGVVSGIATLRYNRGTCSAEASSLGEACVRGPVTAPKINTQWTCGVKLSGTFGCSTSKSSSTSSSSSDDGSGGSSSSQISTSGNGQGSTYTSTSGGGSAVSSSSSSSTGSGFSSSFSGSGDVDDIFDTDDIFDSSVFTARSSDQSTSSSSSSDDSSSSNTSEGGTSTLVTDTGKLTTQKCAVASSARKMTA